MLNCFRNDRHEPCRLPNRDRKCLLVEPFPESLTRTKCGRNKADRADLSGFIHGNQIRVVELGRGEGFANEPTPGVLAQEHFGPRDLQRDFAFQLWIEREEDDAAAAFAQLTPQLESTDSVRPTNGAWSLDRCPSRWQRRGAGQQFRKRAFVWGVSAQWRHNVLAREWGEPRQANGLSLGVSGTVDTLVARSQQARQILVDVQ